MTDNNNWKKCKVHAFSTSKIWNTHSYPIHMYTNDGEWFTNGKELGKVINNDTDIRQYHLYITSDEEIEEGDWVYSKALNLVYKVEVLPLAASDSKKIIATTDSNLVIPTPHPYKEGVIKYPPLPQPSQDFIKKYCDVGGIDEVIVEYINIYESKDLVGIGGRDILTCIPKLKISPDNTITIRKVKDSWTREEVISFAKDAAREGAEENWNGDGCISLHDTYKWIEENL